MILIDRIVTLRSRSPCGERGLKYALGVLLAHETQGRSPCGERGLKFKINIIINIERKVAPRAGSVD